VEHSDAGDGFVTYDPLTGPALDARLWRVDPLPLPDGSKHIPHDPNAEVAVADGEVRVAIPRFSLSDDRFQAADSVKFLALSARTFELPPDRPAAFAADVAVTSVGGRPDDFRRGIAAFQIADLVVTKRVFSVCGTSTRVLAMHEHLALGGGGAGAPFIHVIESPYEDFDDDFTRFRACEVILDRTSSTVVWRVDGRTVYEAVEPHIPERVRIGLGLFTMLPIRNGRSRSLHGQGISARYRRIRTREARAGELPDG
jgi:Family of unknown function (DUF6081)